MHYSSWGRASGWVVLFPLLTDFLPAAPPPVTTHRDSILEGQMLNMPVRQLSIIASSKKHVHGKLRKDVEVGTHG